MNMRDPTELHFQRTLEVAYETVEARLKEGPERWLPGFKTDGDRITGELSYDQGGARVRRRTEVHVGPVQRFAYGVTVQVGWRGAGHHELYPELDGHLRLEPDHPSGCKLRFDARYTPPGGRVGATIDRALMHHVAESSVGGFLDGVVNRVAGG
jgi:hypothetical protein